VASYWLANSVRSVPPVPPSYSRFSLVFARGPAGRGLIGVHRLYATIWLVGSFGLPTGVCCWDRGTTWDMGKGYMLLCSCTHNYPSCTLPILLYSLVPITPNCPTANRWVVQAASDWLANSVWPALTCPVQLFPFWFGVHVRPSRLGSDWRMQFVCRDLVGQSY
jgi:hypothetical protein